MPDFTTINVQYNSAATDASPTWTGTALVFGGSAGANELRFGPSSGTGASVGSASWPYFPRPTSGTAVVPQLWAFTSDTSGTQIQTYDGTSAHYMQVRINWDNIGTYVAAPQASFFSDSTLATPVPGTQPGAQSGSPMINGHATDTSSTSYVKFNAYGVGLTSGGVQQTPSSNAGGTLAATSGTAGAVSPGSAAWLATWQSAQGWTQYILNGGIPQATTAGLWYFVLVLYSGVNQSTGTMLPVFVYQYTFS